MLTDIELKNLNNKIELEEKEIELMNNNINDYLNNLFNNLTDGFEIRPIKTYASLGCWEDDRCNYTTTDKNNYSIQFNVSFKTDDEARIKKGYLYDFGSDFDVVISAKHIYVNHGCSGQFSSADKYQIARLNTLSKLFAYEKKIILSLLPLVNIKLLIEIREDKQTLYRNDLEREKLADQTLTEELKQKLENSVNSYIVNYTYEIMYDKDTDKTVNCLVPSECGCYYITKITPKKVYTVSYLPRAKRFTPNTKIFNKSDLICNLKDPKTCKLFSDANFSLEPVILPRTR